MKRRLRLSPWLLALPLGLALAGWGLEALADGHGHKKRRHDRAAAVDPAYPQACGQCHLAYPPCLLPAASWGKIIEGRKDHFGNPLEMDDQQAQRVRTYLEAYAADRAGGKRSRKIMDSLGGTTPLRPSQVPYIQHKHRKLGQDVFARPAVGGLNNCRACHPGAAEGDFDDDRAVIPR